MALSLDYPDAYLEKFCTEDRESRAFDEVDLLATAKGLTFSNTWRDRLAQLKCYMLACIENQGAVDDLFTAKLKSYRSEYDAATASAEYDARQTAEETESALFFSVPIDRA